jgi:hypothetical protein
MVTPCLIHASNAREIEAGGLVDLAALAQDVEVAALGIDQVEA